ncbi:MAG: choice-of-anchor Q domain-containing protein [Thermoanaerobaculia bacterium]
MFRRRLPLVVILAAAFVGGPSLLPATDRTVDITADENDGTCDAGDCSLREAIGVAADGDTILFSLPGPGPWTITLSAGLGQLSISSDLTIVGPGAADLSISGNNAVRILVVQASAEVTLSGVTFLNGRAPSNADRHGGCVRVLGLLDVSESRFQNCQARTASFDSATAGGDGGAIQVASGATLVADLDEFVSNQAGEGSFSSTPPPGSTAGAGGRGGSLANEGSATLTRCTIRDSGAGGGGDPNANGGGGGAIANLSGGVLRLDESTLSGNLSGDGGSFMSFFGQDGPGGGILCVGDCSLNNVTISGNGIGTSGGGSANVGGGIAVSGGTTRLRNVTVTANTANGNGGGIARSSGTIRTRNSLFSGNAGAGSNDDCFTAAMPGIVSEGHNLLRVNNGCDSSFSGTDLEGTIGTPLEPLLGVLDDNGGPTRTHALGSSSPAIDGGDPAGCLAWNGSGDVAMAADQRGFPRPTDGDGDTLPDCDIGAYEAAAIAPVPHDLVVTLPGAPGGGSVSSDPAGISCPADCSESYPGNVMVELTPAATSGFVFAGWGGDCTGSGACVLAMTADRSVSATFVELFSLDVTLAGSGAGGVESSPSAISCPGVCSAEFVDGTMVELVATPAPGSLFAGFAGDCTGATCTVTMSADRTVTAQFDVDPDVFSDGFESGDVCGWGSAQGAPPC